MKLTQTRRTVGSLLAFASKLIFIVTIVMYTIFGFILLGSHVHTETGLQTQRVEATLTLSQNELLDELALSDLIALKAHLEIIRRDLNADLITIQAPNVALEASNPSIQQSASSTVEKFISLLLIHGGNVQSNISNEFGSISANVAVHFTHQIYQQILQPSLQLFFLSLIFTLFVEILLFLFLLAILNKRLIRPLGHVSILLKEGSLGTDDLLLTDSLTPSTLWEISNLLTALADYQQIRKKADMADIASQVSHDIRSPLTALDMLLPTLTLVPENTRVQVRRAINRIRDIANTLLKPSTQIAKNAQSRSGTLEPVLLVPALEQSLSEKRMEYKPKVLQIECKDSHSLYGIFVHADPIEFGNIISNLINNSVYYLNQQGKITVCLSGEEKTVSVNIHDNGRGISPEVLKILNNNPTTFDKPNGMGFGLRHVKEQMEKWNGSYKITSSLGNWTNVCLTIPKAKPPAWYTSEIDLNGIDHVIILDDDPSIHDVWKSRFAPILESHSNLILTHAFSERDVLAFVKERTTLVGKLFLIDYELCADHCTGIELIEKYGLAAFSRLVTSRWNERKILEKSEKLKLKMIPKEMANSIPLVVPSQRKMPTCILIDDDTTVGDWWNVLGEPLGKVVEAFESAEEFLAISSRYPRSIPVYVDARLADKVHGEDVARTISTIGFKEIYLATGLPKDSFPSMPWITAIRGKECPWGNASA